METKTENVVVPVHRWLVKRQSGPQLLEDLTLLLVQKCVKLGLVVTLEKLKLIPKQVNAFLGDKFDFTRGLILPTDERLRKIETLVQKVLSTSSIKPKDAEVLLSLFVATQRTVPYGRLHLHYFKQAVRKAIRGERHSTATVYLAIHRSIL